MRTTIDKAGRVVIPAPIRQAAGLTPSTELEVMMDDTSIRLVRVVSGPRLVRRRGRLVAQPTVPPEECPDIDVAELIDQERDRWP